MYVALEGKVALVTGGGSGIGSAIARRLHDSGGIGVGADVTSLADMEGVVDTVDRRFGGLDIVAANAAVGANAPLGDITDEKFDLAVATNLKGVLHTVQSALCLLEMALR